MPLTKLNPPVVASRTLEKATISRLEGDVLKIRIHENADIDADDIAQFQQHKHELFRNREYYSLVIGPHFGTVTKEAREYSATPEANKGAIAKAIVSRSLGMRLIVNFFIKVNKPPVPHKVFNSEQEALKWISELKKSRKAQQAVSK